MMKRAFTALGALFTLAACASPTGPAPQPRGLLDVPPVAVPPTAKPPLQPCAPPTEPGDHIFYETQIENQLLDMINELREKANVPDLTQDTGNLRGAAREKVVERSNDLIGVPVAERLTRWCVPSRASYQFARALLPGSYPASDFVTFMTGIPSIKAKLLDPTYNQIGIAVTRGGPQNRLYVALLFNAKP